MAETPEARQTRLRAAREAYARESRENPYDDLSFGAAFNKAKREGRKDFPWRGETYATKTAEEQAKETVAGPRRQSSGRGASAGRMAANRDTDYNLRTLLGTKAPEPKEDALTRIAGRTPARSPEEERDEAKNRTLAALSLMGGLGTNLGLRAIAGRMGAGQAAPAARGVRALEDRIEPPFKKGGAVKTYAKGGSVKGSGCERRGVRPCKVY